MVETFRSFTPIVFYNNDNNNDGNIKGERMNESIKSFQIIVNVFSPRYNANMWTCGASNIDIEICSEANNNLL